MNALHANGLIDEYRFMVFPIVLGGGARLFEESDAQTSLRPVDVKRAADTVLLTYQPA